MYTIFASHGEFARIVITSGDHVEAFYDTIEAFNLAEKYQVPVIHLLDKFLANSIITMEIPDLSSVKIDRGDIVEGGEEYKRFDVSKPISPRALFGSNSVIWYTGSEHDEYGHTNEDPILTAEMYEKRMEKLEIMDREIPLDYRVGYYGYEKPDYLLVGWGFVKNTCLKAMEDLEDDGLKGGYLHLRMFTPFPVNYVEKVLSKMDLKKVIAVEHDYMVQSALAISLYTGIRLGNSIVKYNGRPIYVHELTDGIRKILSGEENRVVLTYGA
jgi:2-oxoglutarate ferredoxin oxidoreductase subunit alpha